MWGSSPTVQLPIEDGASRNLQSLLDAWVTTLSLASKKTYVHTKMCPQMFIAAAFIKAKNNPNVHPLNIC